MVEINSGSLNYKNSFPRLYWLTMLEEQLPYGELVDVVPYIQFKCISSVLAAYGIFQLRAC